MGKRILVVDDDPGIREALEGALEMEGYDITLARNGVEALQKISQNPPELIILDIMMPVMDGFAVAADLEQQGLRPTIPLLVLTADGRAQYKAELIKADGYLEKPFGLKELFKEVARVINRDT